MTIVLIFTIISLFIGVGLFMQSIIKLSYKEGYSWVLPLVLSSILVITLFTNLIIVANEVNKPHEESVIRGDASYAESYHVINGDTIKTYKIVWNKK